MADIEHFLRPTKISFADYEGMLLYLYMQNKDRLLFFTTLTTSKAIKSAQLETKNIISEFNRKSTNPEMPDDNLSPGGEEAALDQDINF